MTANLPRRRGESRSTAERSGQIKLGLFKSFGVEFIFD